jgi:hypothetical protein
MIRTHFNDFLTALHNSTDREELQTKFDAAVTESLQAQLKARMAETGRRDAMQLRAMIGPPRKAGG